MEGLDQAFEVVIAEHFHRAFGFADEAVVMLFHETRMEFFVFPAVKRNVLVFPVGPGKRSVREEPGMLSGFPAPHAAILQIDREMLLLNAEQYLMREHIRPSASGLRKRAKPRFFLRRRRLPSVRFDAGSP